jgi:hypothetical protein
VLATPSRRSTDRKVPVRRIRTDTTARSVRHRDFQDPVRAIEAGLDGYIRGRASFGDGFPASVAGSAAHRS